MHAVKCAWVGQTFALAKCNESEGRRSRIRRSKEERKAMVESFIKRYQSSNNGKFPSLSLTHKEVGGSFYTVREIVREVIQENRVLGPAKLTPKEQNADQFLEQYPLGSISYEPQIPSTSSPNGTLFVSDLQSTSGEVVLTTDGLSRGPELQGLDKERIINGSQVDISSEESNNVKCIELQVGEASEPKKNFEEEMAASNVKMNPLLSEPSGEKENIEEELVAFEAKVNPLVCKASEAKEFLEEEMVASKARVNSLVSEPSEAKENLEEGMFTSKDKVNLLVSEPSEEKENLEVDSVASIAKVNPLAANVTVETFPVRPITEPTDGLGARLGEVRDATSALEKSEVEEVDLGPPGGSSMNSVEHSGLVGKDDARNGSLLENSISSTTEEGLVHNSHGGTDVETSYITEANDQSQTAAEVKAINAPNGTYNHKSSSELISKETKAIASDDKPSAQPGGSAKKGGTASLDRINLESWEGPAKTPAEPEKNPLVAIFKSFIAALVKFWSE